MIIMHWNIRGLNSPLKQQELKRMGCVHKAEIICAVETKMVQGKLEEYVTKCWQGYEQANNCEGDGKGKIVLLWDSNRVKVKVISKQQQYIHCEVNDIRSGELVNVVAVYAHNKGDDRRYLWEDLIKLASKIIRSWITIGDFNNVPSVDEKVGGEKGQKVTIGEVHEFQYCLEMCELAEMRHEGMKFTWSNKQVGQDRIWSRLDRAVINNAWLLKYPLSLATVMTEGISDHCPILV